MVFVIGMTLGQTGTVFCRAVPGRAAKNSKGWAEARPYKDEVAAWTANESGESKEGTRIEKSGEHNSPKECSPLTQDQPTGTDNRKIELLHTATCSKWTQLTGSAGNRAFVTQPRKTLRGLPFASGSLKQK